MYMTSRSTYVMVGSEAAEVTPASASACSVKPLLVFVLALAVTYAKMVQAACSALGSGWSSRRSRKK